MKPIGHVNRQIDNLISYVELDHKDTLKHLNQSIQTLSACDTGSFKTFPSVINDFKQRIESLNDDMQAIVLQGNIKSEVARLKGYTDLDSYCIEVAKKNHAHFDTMATAKKKKILHSIKQHINTNYEYMIRLSQKKAQSLGLLSQKNIEKRIADDIRSLKDKTTRLVKSVDSYNKKIKALTRDILQVTEIMMERADSKSEKSLAKIQASNAKFTKSIPTSVEDRSKKVFTEVFKNLSARDHSMVTSAKSFGNAMATTDFIKAAFEEKTSLQKQRQDRSPLTVTDLPNKKSLGKLPKND
ncbi:MAG: hypothetical protein K0U08_00365 [Proteobacteria bacterium]|nr:hypothetical protein [Pseudomonadota bacterium]